jgi:hypothetical protein
LDARFEQDHPAVSYSCPTGTTWYTATNAQVNAQLFSGGSIASAMSPGCRATFTFTGTAVNWLGDRDVGNGIANVFVDGVLTAIVDTFASSPQYQQVLFSASGLSATSHTLAIEVTDTGNPSSTGVWLNIDAFDIVPAARFEQDHPAVSYSCPAGTTWYTATDARFSGGSLTSTPSPGCQATFTFTGTAVHWIGDRDEGGGIANVFVDGASQGSVDLYGSTSEFKRVLFSASGLSAASHTLTIEVTGTQNPASTGVWLNIDAFDVAPVSGGGGGGGGGGTVTRSEEDAATYAPAGAWRSFTSADIGVTFSGGTAQLSNTAGATATFTFTGTGVSWIGLRCESCGIARAFVDGALAATVDTFAPTRDTATLFTATGLTSGSHTLVIEVTGTSNPSSSSTFLGVDAFDVTGGTSGGGPGGGTVTRSEDDAATYAPADAWRSFSSADIGVTFSGGTAQLSNTAGATATFTFTGTGVSWIGLRCEECGIARVLLDGALAATVDTYTPTRSTAALFTATGLTSASHTLVIEVTGTSNPSSSATFLGVDAFDVTH